MSGFIRPKDFHRYTHYRDRNPPWIKLNLFDVLDDDDYAALDDNQKAHLIGIIALYARTRKPIPNDPKTLARRLGATSKVASAPLAKWIEGCEQDAVEDASAPLPQSRVEESRVEKKREEPPTPAPAASAAPPADAGKAPAEKEKPAKLPKDPLAAFPDLADFFLTLLDHIQGEHPRASIPLHGTGEWLKWRNALASLASGPKGYDPAELQAALEWVFLREQPRGEWPGWKANVRSIPALKAIKGADPLRKIDKIMEQWRRAERPHERKSQNGNGSSNGTTGAAPKRDPAFWARLGLPVPVESEPIAQPVRDDIPF